ncbi:MAG: hypothetical protein K6G42_00515 [Lachnospiraceae bacterium]|nr:hypothetical protein [Lachnospiraceae bacterium]
MSENRKLSLEEISQVSGGIRVKESAVSYQIVDGISKTPVATFTSLEEAKEDFDNYGGTYQLLKVENGRSTVIR